MPTTFMLLSPLQAGKSATASIFSENGSNIGHTGESSRASRRVIAIGHFEPRRAREIVRKCCFLMRWKRHSLTRPVPAEEARRGGSRGGRRGPVVRTLRTESERIPWLRMLAGVIGGPQYDGRCFAGGSSSDRGGASGTHPALKAGDRNQLFGAFQQDYPSRM